MRYSSCRRYIESQHLHTRYSSCKWGWKGCDTISTPALQGLATQPCIQPQLLVVAATVVAVVVAAVAVVAGISAGIARSRRRWDGCRWIGCNWVGLVRTSDPPIGALRCWGRAAEPPSNRKA